MTTETSTSKDKVFKTVSWILLSLVPVLVVAVIGIFSYGMNTQEYIDKIEVIDDDFSKLKPEIEKDKLDIVRLTSDLTEVKKTFDNSNAELKSLKDDATKIDKNVTRLITLFEETEKKSKEQRAEQLEWMHRIEDRLNGRR